MVPRKPRAHRKKAYEQLRSSIVRLLLPPGTALSENDLSASLDMSRTPIREAIMLLVEDGLVEVLPQVGTFVRLIDPSHIAEAQFLREAVELASLRSLTTPLDEEIADQLRNNLDQQDRAGEELDRFFELDEAFHQGLMTLAGHAPTWAAVAAAKSHLDRARRLGMRDSISTHERAAEHRAILDAVISGDIDRAVEEMRRHLRVVFEDIHAIQLQAPHLFIGGPDARPVRRSVIVWE